MRCSWTFAALLGLIGCIKPSLAPADDDPSGKHELYMGTTEAPAPAPVATCENDIELVRASTVTRAHEQLGSLSVTCKASLVRACEQRLAARACELGADAVMIGEGDADYTGPASGVGNPRDRTLGGRAVRWVGP